MSAFNSPSHWPANQRKSPGHMGCSWTNAEREENEIAQMRINHWRGRDRSEVRNGGGGRTGDGWRLRAMGRARRMWEGRTFSSWRNCPHWGRIIWSVLNIVIIFGWFLCKVTWLCQIELLRSLSTNLIIFGVNRPCASSRYYKPLLLDMCM